MEIIHEDAIPWRNGGDAGLVFHGSAAVRAPLIFHFNSGIAVLQLKPETVL